MNKLKIYSLTILGFLLLAGFINNNKTNSGNNSPQTKGTNTVGLEIGNKAPELKFKDPSGKEIALSSLKGKVVLIDFWASWCGPCRRENPNVVKAFNKFKDKKFKNGKGFTIYSVSLDRDKNSWEGAIKQDALDWPYHVSDLKYWASEGAKTYKVASIPASFLIDGDGIIIAKNLRGAALEETLTGLLK